MLRIEVLTLFPGIFNGFLEESLIKKAHERALLNISLLNFREFAEPPHYKVDDEVYGGGAGMLIKPEPLCAAIDAAKDRLPKAPVVVLTPAGKRFDQALAARLSKQDELIFVCGRYEGIDERVCEICADYELSIGDFVMMGGEVAAMAVIEAVTRLRSDVLGNDASLLTESFSASGELEAPQYTRPPEFRGKRVPDVLLSGDHKAIENWRKVKARERTGARRPDLLKAN